MIVAVLTEFGKNTEFYRLYTVVTEGLFFVIPFCIVFVSTMIIIVTLARSRNIFSTDFHMATERLEIQEGTITRTLVAMTTIFIICLSPMTILSPFNWDFVKYQSHLSDPTFYHDVCTPEICYSFLL
jgi:hypothetical protein